MTAGSTPIEAQPVLTCRSCGSSGLRPFLDLGATPIANALLTAADLGRDEPRFPLQVGLCEACSLVQLLYELPAEVIFGADYPYFSSFSAAMSEHARSHALQLIETRGLGPASRVVEVASNDGYLLRTMVEAGIPVLGIEPTPGPAAAARAIGVETLERFFTPDLAAELAAAGLRADVIIANNVMAHVPDLNGFVAGFETILADDGLITIENPWVRDLVEHGEFDTVYHEHFCYFSCHAVDALMRRHGLQLQDVEYFPDLHGGTLRWHVGRAARRTSRLEDALREEAELGLLDLERYEAFALQAATTRQDLVALLRSLRVQGHRIAAYGAAAKGATLLNSSGIDGSLIDFVVDRNPHKQGRWMPGARLPIHDPGKLLEAAPDYLLILAWNFKDEIVAQQEAYRQQGGRFIVPVPSPRIL